MCIADFEDALRLCVLGPQRSHLEEPSLVLNKLVCLHNTKQGHVGILAWVLETAQPN